MVTGDLIFTQIGSPDNAISSVTEGYGGARVNHVGMLVETQLGKFVLEAFPPEVRLTHIHVYLNRSRWEGGGHRYIGARLKAQHRDLIEGALAYGMQQRDVPYDARYLPDESALYCSELIVDMFKHASGGVFFPESPMDFRDIATGEVHPAWVDYYGYFGMPVPEGKAGSNPGDMSKDEKLEVYHVSSNLTGLSI
ncbi:YiiX/YebB-like N1pC/P60 family cysteine hydrolase [Rubritalea tangerina]|uniref:YiiX/YebB-like N1pC/P60 family cysteine hydrolase n=1 Tax=Rubritalea tangerina TaxID=430798 RepID=A0ABW4Z8W3_9BACT